MNLAVDIPTRAREWLRTPFHHQARARGAGVDCIGLLVGVGLEVGATIHDFAAYSRTPNPRELLRHLAEQLDPVSRAAEDATRLEPDAGAFDLARPGDVLVIWFARPTLPQHVGFKTANGIIHTCSAVGRVTEHGVDDDWCRRVHSAWRLRFAEVGA